MMIASNLKTILKNLPAHVTLVAVSKTKPVSMIKEAYDFGHRDFGENKAQEVLDKFDKLPQDIRWHFIGHLQTNKVKQVIDKVHLIHSMDRESLFVELEKQAKKMNRVMEVLLQFHIAEEETKHGFSWAEAITFLNSDVYKRAQFVRVVGVMGMATFTEDEGQIRSEFQTLKQHFDDLKAVFFKDSPEFSVVSMGMSGDYELAVECESNMVRVGSAVFGGRS